MPRRAIKKRIKVLKQIVMAFFFKTNTIMITLFFLWNTAAASPSTPNHRIEFNHVFETGGYNFDITQDKDGFIWVGTINGVKVFNGYEVKSYVAGNNTFPSNNIRTVFVDSEGLVWLATFGGLSVYDKNTNSFSVYLYEPDNPDSISSSVFNGSPNLITESKDGLIWFGTANGLNSFDKKNKAFTRYLNDPENKNSLSDNNILSVYSDSRGVLWIGTKEGGLNKFTPKTKTFTRYMHNPKIQEQSLDIGPGEVNAIAEDADGDLWVGLSKSGLKKFDRKSEKFLHYQHNPNDPSSIANNNIRAIIPGSDGSLWICHPYWVADGMERFDKNKGTFVQYKHDENNPDSSISDRVQVAFEDSSGRLWVGENLSKVSTYDNYYHKFDVYKHNQRSKNTVQRNIIAIIEDHGKDVWLGSGTEGLSKYNPEKDSFTIYPADPDFPEDQNITALYEDSSKNFWICTNNGMLGKYDTKTRRFIKRYHNPNIVEAWGIIEDPLNASILWFATENRGIIKFDKKNEKFIRYRSDNTQKPLLHILGIHKDNENDLWFSSESYGLILYDRKTDSFKSYLHHNGNPKSISSNSVNFFFTASNGDIWVTTQKGLNKFNKKEKTFKRYGEEAGFSSNLRGILEDTSGFLWLTTDAGLLKFDTQSEKVVRTYLEGGREFKFSPMSVLRTTDDIFWLSSSKGVVRFDPNTIKDNPVVPPVFLTSITKGGEDIITGIAPEKIQKIELDWRHNFFEFEYVALNYTRSENNQYAYFLEGFDREWYSAGHHRYGRYSGLPGGRYTLRIKGANNDGIWNNDGASLEVIVAVPWWKTHLFWSLMVSFSIILAVVGYLYRVRTIKNRNTELKRVVNEKTRKLRIALDNVKTLSGLLPICSKCKKIRDDKGYWNHLESYIEKHTEVLFSHGMCLDCSDKLYGNEDWYINMKKKNESS